MFSSLLSNSTAVVSAAVAAADDDAGGGSNATLGFLIAALSAFFNGSFPVWSKATNEEVDPVVFNGLVGLGAFLSSLLVPAMFGQWDDGYVFLPLGFVGGMLLIGATLCSFLAIPRLGLGPAMATWSCAAILVSFLWGAVGPEKLQSEIKSVPVSMVSLLLLIVGAVVIVSNEQIASKVFGEVRDVPGEEAKGSSFIAEPMARQTSNTSGAEAAAGVEDGSYDTPFEAGAGVKVLGLMFSLGVGLFGGSILVPMKFLSCQHCAGDLRNEATGDCITTCDDGTMISVVSFGCGALVAAIVVTLGYWKLSGKPGCPCVNGRTVIIGILSGITWNAGNVSQIVVQAAPFNLAYGIAYPINQCGMLFGGLWGIFVFREIKGKAILVFWLGAVFLVAGVILLGLFGPGACGSGPC